MSYSKSILLIIGVVAFAAVQQAGAHCQIPCGIYGDDARFLSLQEDLTTLKKSVAKIIEESAADKPNQNQLVRWVNNKEVHADNISQVMLTYFLAQRIKEGQKDYEKKLVAIHKIIVLAMKTKQTTDEKIVGELEQALVAFHKLYTAK